MFQRAMNYSRLIRKCLLAESLEGFDLPLDRGVSRELKILSDNGAFGLERVSLT